MIKTLRIRNFQSHKKTEIVFDKGMNVIIGSSDNGKTSIIRALEWILFNKPTGDSFRSWWGGDTYVAIELQKGVIIRERTNSTNRYILNDIIFDAIGSTIPEEVQRVLNVQEINLQKQLDSPFLLSETPGAVASRFNRLAGLEKIDTSVSFVQKKINTEKQQKNHFSISIKEQKNKLTKYNDLDDLEQSLQQIKSLSVKLENLRNEYNSLLLLLQEIEKTKEEIINITGEHSKKNHLLLLMNVLEIIETLRPLLSEKSKITQQYTSLRKDAITIFNVRKQLEKLKKSISIKDDIKQILTLYRNKQKDEVSLNNLSFIYETIKDIKNKQEMKEKHIKKLEKEFKTNFPPVCPLCGTKIKK